MGIRVSDNIRDTVAANLVSALNSQLGGSANLHVFSGAIPTTCADPDVGTELVVCPMDTTPFAGASGNVFVANTITPAVAGNTGAESYYRLKDNAAVVVLQGSAGAIGGEDIVFDNATITSGDTVTVTFLEFTILVAS